MVDREQKVQRVSADGRAGRSSSTSGSAFLFGRKDKDRDRRGRAMWCKLMSKVSIGGGRSGVSKRDRAKKSKHHEDPLRAQKGVRKVGAKPGGGAVKDSTTNELRRVRDKDFSKTDKE